MEKNVKIKNRNENLVSEKKQADYTTSMTML